MTIALDEVVSAVQMALADSAIVQELRTPLVSLPQMARSESRAGGRRASSAPPAEFMKTGMLGHNGSMFGQTVGFRVTPANGAVAAAGSTLIPPMPGDSVLRRC